MLQISFLYLKLDMLDLDLLFFCTLSSTQNRPNGTKKPKVELILHFKTAVDRIYPYYTNYIYLKDAQTNPLHLPNIHLLLNIYTF